MLTAILNCFFITCFCSATTVVERLISYFGVIIGHPYTCLSMLYPFFSPVCLFYPSLRLVALCLKTQCQAFHLSRELYLLLQSIQRCQRFLDSINQRLIRDSCGRLFTFEIYSIKGHSLEML